MTDWAQLRDAYGSASHVEELLNRADSDNDVWDDLWSRLCHQGTVYSSSYAALPRLTDLAARWTHESFNQAIFLATSIIASTDGPELPVATRDRYAGSVRVLHELAEQLVHHAADDTDFVYKVQALLATESDTVWSTRLEALANGELDVECPSCQQQLSISFEKSPAAVTTFGDASVTQQAVAAASVAELVGGEERAYQIATADGRDAIAAQMLDLFGSFQCPYCSEHVTTAVALAQVDEK